MADYWVSKKQYWCKYCNIFVRDDAPSRRLHESGLKHQGNKERFIRDLYKGGEREKREKAAHAAEIARIEAAASAAHSSRDGGAYAGRPIQQAAAPPIKRSKPSGDKWSNYTSAADLGLGPAEDAPSSYEIEQLVRGRTTKVGEWEEVVVPSTSSESAEKRKADEMDPEDLREFKIQQKKHADPYDDDDWDPSSLASLKFKSKEKKTGVKEPEVKGKQNGEGSSSAAGGSRWARADDVKTEPGQDVKAEPAETTGAVKQEPDVKQDPDVKQEPAEPDQAAKTEPAETPAPAAGGSLFKKRRPPPSSRKK